MSFDATRHVWTLRNAQKLEGGLTLLVCLTLADLADQTGKVSVGVRFAGERCGLGKTAAAEAIRTRDRGRRVPHGDCQHGSETGRVPVSGACG